MVCNEESRISLTFNPLLTIFILFYKSLITDVLVLSGYFASASRLVNRQVFVWCDFTFFFN